MHDWDQLAADRAGQASGVTVGEGWRDHASYPADGATTEHARPSTHGTRRAMRINRRPAVGTPGATGSGRRMGLHRRSVTTLSPPGFTRN
jgi:hypothetical protein